MREDCSDDSKAKKKEEKKEEEDNGNTFTVNRIARVRIVDVFM
jgi:hypothetical protein